MKADWKSSDILPDRRIRVLTCDNLGYMETGFFGCQSAILASNKECWRSDSEYEGGLQGREKEIVIEFWDYLPASPIPERPLFG